MNDFRMKRIAYHEAGHLLVAAHEGFETFDIVVRIDQEMSGRAESSPRLPKKTMEQYASSRLRVLLAGAVAQCMNIERNDKQCTEEALEKGNANDDWRKARELARLIAHARTGGNAANDDAMEATSKAVEDEHLEQARAIIESNRPLLNNLARLVVARFKELEQQNPHDLDCDSEGRVAQTDMKDILVKLCHVSFES